MIQRANEATTIVSSIAKLFGDEINIFEYDLVYRSPEKIVEGVSKFINQCICLQMEEGRTVVGIEIAGNEYAEEIAKRIIRGPQIVLSVWYDDGSFVSYKPI